MEGIVKRSELGGGWRRGREAGRKGWWGIMRQWGWVREIGCVARKSGHLSRGLGAPGVLGRGQRSSGTEEAHEGQIHEYGREVQVLGAWCGDRERRAA